jgi:hypothetical protein
MVQLPAVNTPQFDWCVNRTAQALEPVPPIFQPEIVADAVFELADHPRREVFLGWSSIRAIVGNKLAPGYADHYLATAGYTGQLTDEPKTAGPTNLFEPVEGDHGAHGRFDDSARSNDLVARVATKLGAAGVQLALAGALAGVFAGAAIAWRLLRR